MISRPLYRNIDPVTYLECAKALSEKSDDASIRSAVDRAYYSAFLTCRDILTFKHYLIPNYNIDDHKNVPEKLKSLSILGSAGNDELRLRRARNRTTYDTRSLTQGQKNPEDVYPVSLVITMAESIIKSIQKLPDNTQTENS